MPMVSAPLAAASAATTELSTPPDIATTMRRGAIGPAQLEQRRLDRWRHLPAWKV